MADIKWGDGMHEEEWAYVGTCKLKGGETGSVFMQPGEDGERERIFSITKTVKKYRPGTVYKVGVSEDGRRASFADAYQAVVGAYSDAGKVLEWRMVDRAKEEALKAKSLHDKANVQAALEALEPLTRAYWSLTAFQQAALEILVLQTIRGQRPPTRK